MAKSKRVRVTPPTWSGNIDARLSDIERTIGDFIDACEERLSIMGRALAEMEARTEADHYALLYTMQRTSMREKRQSSIVIEGEPAYVEDLLYAFWLRDRESFIAYIKEKEAEIHAQLESARAANPTVGDAREGSARGPRRVN